MWKLSKNYVPSAHARITSRNKYFNVEKLKERLTTEIKMKLGNWSFKYYEAQEKSSKHTSKSDFLLVSPSVIL
jgi:hypothetical protein